MPRPKPFTEYEHFAGKNRQSAAQMHTTITKMHDRTWGSTLFWDTFFMSLTRDELMKLAGMIVRDLDELEKRNTQPRRTITRSYQETTTGIGDTA